MADEQMRLLVDTNLLLHFLRPDQIDWCELCSVTVVELLVAPTTFRELDRQRVIHPSAKIRKRAADAVRWLSQFETDDSPRAVRAGVTLRLLDTEPAIDFTAHCLDPTLNDDRLLAHCLHESLQVTSPPVGIVSADAGIRVKARRLGIRSYAPGDTLRLPDARDEEQRELQQLRADNAALRHRQPRLNLALGTNGESHIGIDAAAFVPLSADELASRIRELELKHPELRAPTESLRVGGVAFSPDMFGLSRQAIDLYNRQRNKYLQDARDYHLALNAYGTAWRRPVPIALTLTNNGTSPATDVALEVDCDEDADLWGPDDEPPVPSEPEPPEKPTAPNALAGMNTHLLSTWHRDLSGGSLTRLGIPDPRSWRIDTSARRVARCRIPKVQQGHVLPLEILHLRAKRGAAVDAAAIRYWIQCDESPEAFQGELTVEIRDVPSA